MSREEQSTKLARETPGLRFFTLEEMYAKGFEGPHFTIEHLIADYTLTTLAGMPGAGKTPLALCLCEAILTGKESVLGFKVSVREGFKIAYLTQESPPTFNRAAFLMAGIVPSGQMVAAPLYEEPNFDVSWARAMDDRRLLTETAWWS